MEKEPKKSLIKISFGEKGNEEQGLPNQPENEGMEENHTAILTKIKSQVEQIPGTEKIIAAIDDFLNSEESGESYEETENKENKVFGSFSDYFGKKVGNK